MDAGPAFALLHFAITPAADAYAILPEKAASRLAGPWPRPVYRQVTIAPLAPPPPPHVRISLGVTGHRLSHPGFATHLPQIEAVLTGILEKIDALVTEIPPVFGPGCTGITRMHCLLADGADALAAELALKRCYELVALLPFGPTLNRTINAQPLSAGDARAILAGLAPDDAQVADRAASIDAMSARAATMALADNDARVIARLLAHLDHPEDAELARLYGAETSQQVAVAGTLLIEQSDLLIAIWDGATTAHPGGTGHTVAAAIALGSPVLWIDPTAPEAWRFLRAPEALAWRAGIDPGDAPEQLERLVRDLLGAGEAVAPRARALDQERWRESSHRLAHGYRRIEALFGGGKLRHRLRGLRQRYDHPDALEQDDSRAMLTAMEALPGADGTFAARVTDEVVRRFTWVDGVSARLSDAYRGGMTINFLLSGLAITGGVAYLPLASPDQKWGFALFELVLLGAILLITAIGRRRRWHGRWFETRRLAEYLRHSPLLLALGTARAPGRWPQGAETSWPEFHARQTIRSVGLPRITLTNAYLHSVLATLIQPHVAEQRDYHLAKAQRLTSVHHRLDHLSERLFQLAVAAVATYLVLKAGVGLHQIDHAWLTHASPWFTLLGVAFPTFGAAIAGVRYFGDFERFAAISQVTAAKLDGIAARIALLLRAPDAELTYCRVAELAHATDEIVFSEIENWQAVFGGKQISVPV